MTLLSWATGPFTNKTLGCIYISSEHLWDPLGPTGVSRKGVFGNRGSAMQHTGSPQPMNGNEPCPLWSQVLQLLRQPCLTSPSPCSP